MPTFRVLSRTRTQIFTLNAFLATRVQGEIHEGPSVCAAHAENLGVDCTNELIDNRSKDFLKPIVRTIEVLRLSVTVGPERDLIALNETIATDVKKIRAFIQNNLAVSFSKVYCAYTNTVIRRRLCKVKTRPIMDDLDRASIEIGNYEELAAKRPAFVALKITKHVTAALHYLCETKRAKLFVYSVQAPNVRLSGNIKYQWAKTFGADSLLRTVGGCSFFVINYVKLKILLNKETLSAWFRANLGNDHAELNVFESRDVLSIMKRVQDEKSPLDQNERRGSASKQIEPLGAPRFKAGPKQRKTYAFYDGGYNQEVGLPDISERKIAVKITGLDDN